MAMDSRTNLYLFSAATFLAVAFALSACEGVGVVATDDPHIKLAQANYLLNEEGRVMQARRQLDEAIPLLEKNGDKAGLAEAYRLYGLVVRVDGPKDNRVVRIDTNAPITSTKEQLDLSDDYLNRALGLAQESNQSYNVANIYFLLGNNEILRGVPLKSCPYYDLAIKTSTEAEREHPGTKVQLMPGVHSAAEGYALTKKQAGCPGA
jgi:tetratricopeptide (TPR) repeat protein